MVPVLRQNNKVMRVRRKFSHTANISYWSIHIEEERLVIWIDRVQNFIARNDGVDLLGHVFDLWSVLENHHCGERVADENCRGNEGNEWLAHARPQQLRRLLQPRQRRKRVLGKAEPEQHTKRDQQGQTVTRRDPRSKVDEQEGNYYAPGERPSELALFTLLKPVKPQPWHKNQPWQKIDERLRQCLEPIRESKEFSGDATDVLAGPFLHDQRTGFDLKKGHSPQRENAKHNEAADEVGWMQQVPPLFVAPEHRHHDGVEEEQKSRTFGQPAEPETNPRHGPC